MNVFSPAQIAGYAAFFLGVTAFLQKCDRRLKFFIASINISTMIRMSRGDNPEPTEPGVFE